MLNTISGGSTLPRDVIQWLDGLDLSYSVRNPKMDLSNGFIVAEILTRKFPSQLSIYTFYNALAKDKKVNNWQQIQTFLAKKSFKLTKQQYESIINLGPQTAAAFLFRLYQFITDMKLNIDRRLASTIQAQSQPLYSKPTASYIAKDRQLHRVIDLNQKQKRTKTLVEKHKKDIHTQKYNTGLIQWLIQKRKEEIENQVKRQKQLIEKKTKSVINTQAKIEVKEIQLKCFNSSTSKKSKGQYGDFLQNKGVLEFLTESCSLLFKKQHIANDLKKLNLDVKDKEVGHTNILQEMFRRCDQLDIKGNRKLTEQTIKRLFQQFKKTSEMNLIIDNIHNNFMDFKKFLHLFLKPLKIYDKDSEIYKIIIDLISSVSYGLHKINSENTQMMFQQIFLSHLLQIGDNQSKRSSISSLCLKFARKESQSYFLLIQKVKQIYKNNMKVYIAYLAQFIDVISKQCENIQQNLWSQFFYYGFLALSNASPSVRVNGTKIISKLFMDIVVASDEIITEKLTALKNLIHDPWWQVRAQALMIFKAILLSKYKNQSLSQSASINDDLTMKTILHYILQIFNVNVSHNILRIGLIELAQLLNYQQSLCKRYLEILLHVGNQIRVDVLTTSVIKYGPVVYGAKTFSYKLTGAPLVWNSIGITKVLHKYIQEQNITQLNKSHLEILHSSLIKNAEPASPKQWLIIYEAFKDKVFEALLDEQLCQLAASIIKQFFEIQQIHADIVDKSKTLVSLILSKINRDIGESQAKTNLLKFFDYLKTIEPEYTYQILKDFAEKEKSKYLSSNFVDFMNNLSRQRRKKMFQNEI